MATSTSKHVFEFLGKSDSLTKASKSVQKELTTTEKAMGKVGSVAKYALAGVAVAAVGKFVTSSINAAKEAEVAQNRLEAVFKATGESTTEAAEDAAEYAGELSKLIGVDDELIMASQAILATFKNVSSETARAAGIFDQATAAAADLAAAGFGSLESNAKLLGIALNDPAIGMGKLAKAGVNFTEDQKAAIESMVESNDLLGAQKIILGEIETQVGGTAAATATSFDKMAVAVDELQEKLGGALMPLIDELPGVVEAITPAFEDFAAGVEVVVDALTGVEGGMVQAAAAVPVLAGALAVLYFNPVVAVLGAVALAIVGIGYAARTEAHNIDVFTESLNALGEVDMPAVAELIDPKAIAAADELGVSLETMTDMVNASDEEFDAWVDRLKDAAGGSNDLRADVLVLAENLRNLRQDTDDAREAQRELDDEYRTGGPDEQGAIDRAIELAGAQGEAARETDRHTASVENQMARLRAATDPVFAYTDAKRAQRDAEREATEALDEFGIKSPQYKEAIDNLTQANIDLEEAENGVADVDLGPYRRELIESGIQSGLTRDQAVQAADDIIASIARVNAQEFEDKSFIVTETHQVIGGKYGKGASGGRFDQGDVVLVGEEGPEVVTFGAAGTVIPNDKLPVVTGNGHTPTAAATMATLSPVTNEFHFHGPVFGVRDLQDAVIQALETARARGRTIDHRQPLRSV